MAQPWLHLITRDALYWYCTVPIFEIVPKGFIPVGLAAPRSSIHSRPIGIITSWLNQHINANTTTWFAIAPGPFSTPLDAPGLILSTP
jgi:hypothetical protein